MRVLLTTDTIGGVWTFTRELASGLMDRGHEVALVSFGRMPSDEQQQWVRSREMAFGPAFRYASSDAPLEWMQENERAYSDGAKALYRVAEAFGPDVMHSSQFCFGGLELGVPKVITAHSDVLSWAAACQPNGLEPGVWLSRYVELVENGLRAADAAVAPTKWMACELARHYGDLPGIEVILNGRSVAAVHGDGRRKLQAVTVGRLWDEAKNVSILRDVRSSVPILVAGEQQHEGATAPVEIGSAKVLGRLAEDALLGLFRESSIYVATSVYEPFGLAPLEAALCGCAVIANDIGSLREVWGDAALYFRDAQSLSAGLRDLGGNPGALAAARERAYGRALELSASRMTEQYEGLYGRLLSAGAGVGAAANTCQELAVHVA